MLSDTEQKLKEEAPVQSVSSSEDRFGIHEYEWAFGTGEKKEKKQKK